MRPAPSVGTVVLTAALLLLCCRNASAGEVLLVKSSEAAPYAQAESALSATLSDRKHSVRSVLLKEMAEKGVGPTVGRAELVVGIGTPAAAWLKKQLPEPTKLAYCMVNNADSAGLLSGRQASGVVTELGVAAQMELVAAALPKARVVGLLYRSDTPEGRRILDNAKAAAPADWRIEPVAVNDYPGVAAAIDALTRRNIDIVWTTADGAIYDAAAIRSLLLSAMRRKLPVWGFSPAFVKAGALIGVGVEPAAQGTQAADLADQLLKSPDATRVRVEPPKQYQIAVNLIVAGQIGIELPEEIVKRAAVVVRQEK